MFGFSEIIDVALGLVFVFLLLSLVATWAQEWVATTLNWRSKHLVEAIAYMLDPGTDKPARGARLQQQWSTEADSDMAQKLSENTVQAFYEHSLVKGLTRQAELPAYIPTRIFGVVLFDILMRAGTADPTQVEQTLENFRAGIEKIENPATKEALLSLVRQVEMAEQDAEKQLVALRNSLEAWFDMMMDQASGWYKRAMQWRGLIIGVILAVVFNADAVGLASALYQDPVLRNTVSASAVAYVERGEEANADTARARLQTLGLPLGWSSRNIPDGPVAWLVKVLGWLLSGFAISQGAPFWFDLLNRFVNIRGTGKRPAPASAEA